MDLFSVLLKEDVAVDPRTYGAILAPALGVTVHDARMAVRRGGGILAEDLPEEEARKLAESLEGDGIGCWCAPSSALPPLPPPRRVTRIEATEEGLRCSLLNQPEPSLLAWDRIGAVSLGLVLVPELQEEIAGVRKKDVAAVARREQEQRDLVRDRMLAFLARVDLSHEENAPAAAAHHYFFDQLRRRESKQLKGFVDLVSADGSEWWRLPLDESSFMDGGAETANYAAVPVIYSRRKEAHTGRSLQVLQGGNIERLAFHTMEEFNRYTRWWTWRERLRIDPELALPTRVPASGGNGHAPRVMEARATLESEPLARPKGKARAIVLAAAFTIVLFLAAGIAFERRGADCLICRRNRQDDVVRMWGFPLKEKPGPWTVMGPSLYDQLINREHEHLFDGYGYVREGLMGFAPRNGRTPGGNATPAEVDAAECVNGLLAWYTDKQATVEEVQEAYPKLYERVRNSSDRKRWLELARAPSNRDAPVNLLKEATK